jgi:hypothetical protein
MHQFNYRALLTTVGRQAARAVPPAYTSIMGRFKYQPQYGPSYGSVGHGLRGGLKVWRENLPKDLQQWMQAQNQ